MSVNWPDKDPNEILDYAIVWTRRGLGTDTITSTTATVVRGAITVVSHAVQTIPNYTAGHVTVTWLSGGVRGQTVELLLRAVTTNGRTLDQTVLINIVDK